MPRIFKGAYLLLEDEIAATLRYFFGFGDEESFFVDEATFFVDEKKNNNV